VNGPIAAALSGNPALAGDYLAFRQSAEQALPAPLVVLVRQAIADVHGCADTGAGVVDEAAFDEGTRACLAYARRIPYEHTAITDGEAARVIAALGEAGFVAFSVVAALADAECRAALVDLPTLADAN